MPSPLEAVPAVYEDNSADVFVEEKCDPHTDEPPAEHDAEEVAEADTDGPLDDDADDEREIDVARSSEGIGGIDVDALARLKKNIDPEDCASQCNDLWVAGEYLKYVFARQCAYHRECEAHHDRDVPYIFAYEVGGMNLGAAHHLSDEDRAAVGHADGKEIDEHEDVAGIGSCGERVGAYEVDEIQDYELLHLIGDVLAGRWQSDVQQVPELAYRERTEQRERQCVDGGTEQDDKEDDHCHQSRDDRRDGCTLDTECRHAELTEDERVVTEDVEHVDDTHHDHRIDGLVDASQYSRCRGLECLKDGEAADDLHVDHSVGHEIGTESHELEDALGAEEHEQTHGQTCDEVEDERHADNLFQARLDTGSEVLGTQNRCTGIDDGEEKKEDLKDLVVHTHGSHSLVAVLAEHEGIHHAKQHDEKRLDKDRHEQFAKISFYTYHYFFPGLNSGRFRALRLKIDVQR